MSEAHVFFQGDEPAPRRRAPPVHTPRDLPDATVLVDPSAARLYAALGIDAPSYNAASLARRFPASLRALRVNTADAAVAAIAQPRLRQLVLDALLVGVTRFFRDPAVFEQLAGTVLPALVAESPALRVASIGVAQGQELYSVAMLLREAGHLAHAQLLGLDFRRDALERAAAGHYADNELVGLSDARRDRHLRPDGRGWTVLPELRARARWRPFDVLSDALDAPVDLLLYRNVGIYLRVEAADHVWARLLSFVRVGGVVVTGTAERPPSKLGWVPVGPCLYRRTRT